MKRILSNIAELSNFSIEVMESDKDHIHMMISSEPKPSPLQIVKKLKQMSTIAIWKKTSLKTTTHILEGKHILDRWILCCIYRILAKLGNDFLPNRIIIPSQIV